jgi:hypothetical protein
MAEFIKNACTCIFCSEVACCASCCVDAWWGTEAEGLALLACGNCCWKSCAPICFTCTCGDVKGGMQDCVTGLKYCLFSCGACLVAPVDGFYSCGQAIVSSCGGQLKSFNVMKTHFAWLATKLKTCLGIESSNEPLNTLGKYSP